MSLAGAAPTGIGALAAAYVDAGMEGKAAEACDQRGDVGSDVTDRGGESGEEKKKERGKRKKKRISLLPY